MQFNPGFGTVLATLSAVLLLPVSLTLLVRNKALRAATVDRAAVWFSFVRFLRWHMIGTLALWWVATDLVSTHRYVNLLFFANGRSAIPAGYILSLFLLWLPPMLVLVFCQALAQPIYSGVRGIAWTHRDLMRQAALTLGVSLIPILFVVAGFHYLFYDNDVRDFLLSCVVAVSVSAFSARRLRALLQLKPNALTVGELRDRVFALAPSLGVKLQQVYVLQAGKMRMANAFARAGNSILLTDYLLTNLSKREVDFVVAHELAHLKHEHPRKLGLAALSGFVPVLSVWILWPGVASFRPLFDILFILSPLCVYYFFARRFEFTVDADAARLTGDPQAAATCLVKIHRLNLMPTQWGKLTEKFLTHPSTVRRAQAIARAAGIPREQLSRFLETAFAPSSLRAPEEAERYSLPQGFAGQGKVFSTEFKQLSSSRASWAQVGSVTLIPAFFVWLVQTTGWLRSGWTIVLIGLLITAGVSITLTNFLPFAGYKKLERLLREKFEREGVNPGDGILVGFSPDSAPRIYEKNYSWDVGFLFLSGGALIYWGEEARFALRREQIDSVWRGPGIPHWLRPQNFYIRWLDESRHKATTFNLRPIGVRSMLQMKREMRYLARRIEAWRMDSAASTMIPPILAALGPPSIGQVTGTSPKQSLKSRQIFASFVFIGFLAGCFASLLGLPVDVTTPVARIFGLVPPEHAELAGGYGVLIAWLAFLILLVPQWLYREKSGPSGNSVANPRPVSGHE